MSSWARRILPCRRLARCSLPATRSSASIRSRRARQVAGSPPGNRRSSSSPRAGSSPCTRREASKAPKSRRVQGLNADAGVVVAYGQILPKAILDAPRYGCFNIHASLLPRWRGAAPIQRAFWPAMPRPASRSCASRRRSTPVPSALWSARHRPRRDGGRAARPPLRTRRGAHGAGPERSRERLARLLAATRRGGHLCRQDRAGRDAHRLVSPGRRGAQSDQGPLAPSRRLVRGRSQRQARARQSPALDLRGGRGQPATVLDDQLTIACGKGSVRLLQVQRAGKRPMPVAEFRRGAKLPVGSLLR